MIRAIYHKDGTRGIILSEITQERDKERINSLMSRL